MPAGFRMAMQMGMGGRSQAEGSGGWSPFNLGSKLLEWWDSSSGVNLSGSNVTSWVGKKSGYTVAQGTGASQPTYSATSFNGAPGLTFDGTDDYLELASQPFPSGAAPSEIWGVCQQNALSGDATARILCGYGGDSSVFRRGVGRASGNVVSAASGNGAIVPTSGTSTIFTGRVMVRGIFSATAVTGQVNATVDASSPSVPATGTSRVRIGAISNAAAGSYWNGLMRDVIVTGLLSAEEEANLQTFLLNRRLP